MKVVFSFTLILLYLNSTFASAQSTCGTYLNSATESSLSYEDFKLQLNVISKEHSVRKILTLFNTFKLGYHARYDAYSEALIAKYPDLKSNTHEMYNALSKFYKSEKDAVSLVERALLQIPAKKRIHYLRSLTLDQLAKNSLLLDTLFGLDLQKLDQVLAQDFETQGQFDVNKKKSKFGDEEIWYAPGAGQQTDWSTLIKIVEDMNLQPGQTLSDFGSGIGRLGFLIGLLRPDIEFLGLELVPQRVDFANAVARQNGFTNVHFKITNLADTQSPLPELDHIYMFNPTNTESSELLTQRLVQLRKPIEIHIFGGFNSATWNHYFLLIDNHFDNSNVKTYVKRRL